MCQCKKNGQKSGMAENCKWDHVCEWSRQKHPLHFILKEKLRLHFILEGAECEKQNPTPGLDLQSGEGASCAEADWIEGARCAEADKQNVSPVTTSNRAAIPFETCLDEYCNIKIYSS